MEFRASLHAFSIFAERILLEFCLTVSSKQAFGDANI
jgi:hypothetical protein